MFAKDAKRGDCRGCGHHNVVLHPTHEPQGLCYSCVSKIVNADKRAASRIGIRLDMRDMGVPLNHEHMTGKRYTNSARKWIRGRRFASVGF